MINTTKEVLSNFKNIVLSEGKEAPVKYTDPFPIHLKEASNDTRVKSDKDLVTGEKYCYAPGNPEHSDGRTWIFVEKRGTGEYEFKDEKDSDFKCLTKSLAKWYKVADGAGNSDKSLDEVLDALISGDIKPQEQPEEGTSISLAQLEDICKNVEFIKSQIGEGDIVPDWALQHITVAADNIHEVVVFFEGEEESESPEEQADEDIHMIGEAGKKKPSAGLSKKEKSAIVKKAEKGEDIGKKGKSFEKIAKKAGGGEKGDKIAGSIMWKQQAKKAK